MHTPIFNAACPNITTLVDRITKLNFFTSDLTRLKRQEDGPSQFIYLQRSIIHQLQKRGTRLAFLIKCRSSNILPKSIPNKKRLHTAIRDAQGYIQREHALLMRNFDEYGMSNVFICSFVRIAKSEHHSHIYTIKALLNTKYQELLARKRDKYTYISCNHKYPIYNFTAQELPHDILKFMQKFSLDSNTFQYRPSEIQIMAENESLASELQDLHEENNSPIFEEQKMLRFMRQKTYGLFDAANREWAAPEHKYKREMLKKLEIFCKDNNFGAAYTN